jgi:hypothetical protein
VVNNDVIDTVPGGSDLVKRFSYFLREQWWRESPQQCCPAGLLRDLRGIRISDLATDVMVVINRITRMALGITVRAAWVSSRTI